MEKLVKCPVCEKEMSMHLINKHLDRGCEDPVVEPSSTSSAAQSSSGTGGNGSVASIFQTPKKRPAAAGGTQAQTLSGTKRPSAGFGETGIRGGQRSKSTDEDEGNDGADGVKCTNELATRNHLHGSAAEMSGKSLASTLGFASGPPPSKKQKKGSEKLQDAMPLAERVRPVSLDDICGQDLVGPNGVLRGLIESERVPSMILWGTAGCGKTTIARVIAKRTKGRFVEISATNSGVAECKKIFQDAKSELMLTGRKTILFCDEIHRFSKSQQDVFLAPVESGQITLIGATTENPSFKVQSALLSRCRVFTLKKLSSSDIEYILQRAMESVCPHTEDEDGSGSKPIIPPQLDQEMLSYLALFADGDARTALNLLDLALSLAGPGREGATKEEIKKSLTRTLVYDRSGDMHYDTISAFHKSVRGSNADAALFWLGRMLAGGEDPLYIARRMVVIASEDVGLADNSLLPLATATYTAVQQIGLPEARINLAHCAVALAEAKKSVRAYRGLSEVMTLLDRDPVATGAPIPYHLRNAPTKLMKNLGYGKDYKYNPDYQNGEVLQDYLPEGLPKKAFLEDMHLGRQRDPELDALRSKNRGGFNGGNAAGRKF
ncbi:DNA-dependent ATPase MGS1 [Peziza echinospora]|nr:DNA-dependent ATPase MGS1 [Peziza echinospora]